MKRSPFRIGRKTLRNSFNDWIETVDEIPECLDLNSASDQNTPDLYSFYAALTAMASENRKANRKFAEALSQWQDGMNLNQSSFDQIRSSLAIMAAEVKEQETKLSRSHCLALVEILDRMRRLSSAFASNAPAKTWWSQDAQWRKAWNTQAQAFGILIAHFDALLKKEDVVRMDTVGKSFDPVTMMAVAAEPDASRPHHTVVEEVAAGYLWRGGLLRVAQVKVSTNLK